MSYITKRFKAIQEGAISDAEGVNASIEEFRLGLANMWHILNERIQLEGIDPRSSAVLNAIDEDDQ